MTNLIVQLVLGGALITAATALQVCFIGAMMMTHPAAASLLRRMSILKAAMTIAASGLWMIIGQMVGVWVWAAALMGLGAFSGLEESLYFSLSAYTTLGFGDVLPAEEWRILGALIGANGMLGFGLATAALVEFLSRVRPSTDDLGS